MANQLSTTLLSLLPKSSSQNPTTNESSSSINESNQLDLNQMVADQLRKSSVATTNGVCVQKDSPVLLGHDDEASVTEKVIKPQPLYASLSSSQPNKEVGGTVISAKMKYLLNSQLRYASFIRGRLMKPNHVDNSHQTTPTSLLLDESRRKSSTPYPLMLDSFSNDISNKKLSETMNETNRNINNHRAQDDKHDDGDDEINGDCRIRSIPYKKNGPYTCSKCKQVFPTSQFFASHVVSTHYKYETKDQRRKRLNARIQRRNLRLQQVDDGLTLVPVSSEVTGNNFAARFGQDGQVNVKVEADRYGYDQVPFPVKEVANGNGFTRANIKFKPDV